MPKYVLHIINNKTLKKSVHSYATYEEALEYLVEACYLCSGKIKTTNSRTTIIESVFIIIDRLIQKKITLFIENHYNFKRGKYEKQIIGLYSFDSDRYYWFPPITMSSPIKQI